MNGRRPRCRSRRTRRLTGVWLLLCALVVAGLTVGPLTTNAAAVVPPGATAVTSRVSGVAPPHAPRLGGGVASMLARRAGGASVAVEDLNTGEFWTYNPGYRGFAGSIVKVNILEAVLHRAPALQGENAALANAMIRASDNGAASWLWRVAGLAPGIGRFNRAAKLRCTATDAGGRWGLTLTCARDQLRLLELLARPNRLLSRHARAWALWLMRHVRREQAWGVSGSVPRGVPVALKNGWLPDLRTYNSVGWVHGRGRSYLIAVLTRSPSMSYGVATIERVSREVWRSASRLPPTP